MAQAEMLIPVPEIWTDTVRSAWIIPRGQTVSEWSDKNRTLDPKTSAEPGQWRTSRTPYLRGPMDVFNDPFVEEVTLMFSTQVGKTEAFLNCLGFAIDQDPGPTLWVQPREQDAKTFSNDRLKRMIELSSALSGHMTGVQDNISKLVLELDRMIIYLAGSNSPAALSGKPIRYLLLDETDKYPPFSGKEADPIKLSRERTRTFKVSRKILKCSTPTVREGYINREYELSDRCKYYVPCPYCGEYQVLIFTPQLKWPKEFEAEPEKIKNQSLAWYECSACSGRINDSHKQAMLEAGKWVPDGCSVNKDGTIIGEIPQTSLRGFWISALYSPWLSFSEIAAEFLSSKDDPQTLMNFVNSWLAEIWEENLEHANPDKIRKLIRPYKKHTVPMEVKVLTAAVDVQKDYFILAIRGWGIGQRSWGILADRVETWDDVEDILFNTCYPSEISGIDPFKVRLALCDTGYRTDEVYEFCRQHRDQTRAIKGVDHLNGPTYIVSVIDRMPKSGKIIPNGGLKLWRIDTSYFKDKVSRLAQNTEQESSRGGWYIPEETTDDYIKQFCAEHKVAIRDKRRRTTVYEWRKIHASGKNNYWDVEVYNAAAADMLRVYAMREADFAHRQAKQEQRSQNSFVPNRSGGSWLGGRRPGWIKR